MGLEPITKIQSESLHELNVGKNLELFTKQKTMKIGFVVNKEPDQVKIFKALKMVLNIKYNVKLICITTSLGQTKNITGQHFRYKNKEGKHSVPLKNITDKDDLRGSWAYIEIEVESINNQKIDFFAVVVYLRNSII
jgi:hypothetical protein